MHEIISHAALIFVDDDEAWQRFAGKAFSLYFDFSIIELAADEIGEMGRFGFAGGVQDAFFAVFVQDVFVDARVDALKKAS